MLQEAVEDTTGTDQVEEETPDVGEVFFLLSFEECRLLL